MAAVPNPEVRAPVTTDPSLADVDIGILRPADGAALAELFCANDVPEVTRFFDPFPLTASMAARLVRYEGRDRHWGIWVGERLAGLVMVRGWDEGHPHPTLGIIVDRRARGGGVAFTAVELALNELRACGEPLVRAKFHEENLLTSGLISKAPWRVVSRGSGRVVIERDLSAEQPWVAPARVPVAPRGPAGDLA